MTIQNLKTDASTQGAHAFIADMRHYVAQADPGPSGTKQFIWDISERYTAFVFLGFFFAYPLAVIGLWLWEVAGFIRYKGQWSQRDITCGYVGIRHGRQVRKHGPTVLPNLVADDLVA